jgi:MFS superfamily sulfate permease-like transporter
MGWVQALRSRVRFDRNELAGSFGDIGTDLPLIVAMIPAAGLDAASVFILFGSAQIATGLLYGLPMPMQPLKAMAVIVITQGLPGEVLRGAGLAIGAIMLVLSASGALNWLARLIPPAVVRGIQLGLGLNLAALALQRYVPADGAAGFWLAGGAFALTVALLGNRRLPPALPVIALGIVYAMATRVDLGQVVAGVGLSLPVFSVPSWDSILTGFLILAIPQLPLSLSNSVIATDRALRDLFPERPVGIRRIGLTYAAANLIVPFFGGLPVCHGCGGLAGHHAFGARTGGSVVIYGSMLLAIGLFFAGAAAVVVQIFPQPILGVILLFEALALMVFVRDVAGSGADTMVAFLVAVLALGLPHGFVIGAVVGTLLHYLARRFGILGA